MGADMNAERRFTPMAHTRVEKRGEDGPTVITGYAAVFYRDGDPGTEYSFKGFWDDFTERILPTAFDRALREGDDVRALFNHDANEILGRSKSGTLKLTVDTVGLRYEIEPPDTPAAKTVVEGLRRGDISGSSFAFAIDEQVFREVVDPDTDNVRVIREIVSVRLYDVGPVTYPAYESTTAGVRSSGDLDEVRGEYEKWKASQAPVEEREEPPAIGDSLSLDQVRVNAMLVQIEEDAI